MIDNAATQIVAASKEVFAKGWELEVSRQKGLFEAYNKIATDYAEEVAVMKAKVAAKEEEWIKLYRLQNSGGGVEVKFMKFYTGRENASYNNIKGAEYKRFKEAFFKMLRFKDKGFDEVMNKDASFFFDAMSGFMQAALAKKGVDKMVKAEDISINYSAKGYTVTALVDGRRLVTECISAGGYNIQCFHYRYLVKLS